MSQRFSTFGISGIPLIRPGDDLVGLLLDGLKSQGDRLEDGDILIVTQKVVSKSENQFVNLADVIPSPRAIELAQEMDKDARVVEIVLQESRRIVRATNQVLITEHRLGFVMANAGVDVSNIEQEEGQPRVLLLPKDPDLSARKIRSQVREATGAQVAVVINDSAGRPWRKGVTSLAIGTSGLQPIEDVRNTRDLFEYRLRVTEIAVADLVAGSASLVMGEAAEGVPAAVVRGLDYSRSDAPASTLLRPEQEDLFR